MCPIFGLHITIMPLTSCHQWKEDSLNGYLDCIVHWLWQIFLT